jgi:aspartyl-tRNA(Asn)/glutamyl-tRNA(Gln) amidotransferase subunit C
MFNKNSSDLKIGIIDANRLSNIFKINQWDERTKMSNKKSIVDIPTVNKIARLSRLDIPEKNKQSLTNDLNNILGFVANLEEVDTSSVEPLASVTGHKLPLRSDIVTDGNMEDLVLKNAPESSSGFFVVPKVIE